MPKITEHFEEFKLNRQLINAVEDLNFQKPTPIQVKAIPLILAGHDLIGIAQTGTGKTAAYLLPLLMKVKYAQGLVPRALILAPTKELVIQIDEQVHHLVKYCDIRHICLYGGIGAQTQIKAIGQGVDIIVSTPGRFMDLYLTGSVPVKAIKTMVLDEADKMMDMGFMPQIRRILEVIPNKRQNLLFSATFPDKVQRFSEEFLEFPETVSITPQSTPAETVLQYFYRVPNLKSKINLLQYLLSDPLYNRVMVFVRAKEMANNIFKFLTRKIDGEIRVIHANKSQNSRINAFNQFREGEVRVLVSTDVSSRGLDISNVSHVINFEVPLVYEDYIHRIGRTGRAENKGIAITFANDAEMLHLQKIEEIIKTKIEEKPIPDDLEITVTESWEVQKINREIDQFKRREFPEFKGAFHEKKRRKSQRTQSGKKGRRR